jgi:multiple antibiotic resistance protein
MKMSLHKLQLIIEASILVMGALFPIVNPIGSAAELMAMVDDLNRKSLALMAKKIALYSFFVLFLSMLLGTKISSFFGISLYSVQIGGGLVVMIIGWQLLSKDDTRRPSSLLREEDVLNRAFYPFTLPITVGPGSISVAVALGSYLPVELHASSFLSPEILIASVVGTSVISASIYICSRWARDAEHLLGESGTKVLMRLSSFISLCIGVQILAGGYGGLSIRSSPFFSWTPSTRSVEWRTPSRMLNAWRNPRDPFSPSD